MSIFILRLDTKTYSQSTSKTQNSGIEVRGDIALTAAVKRP